MVKMMKNHLHNLWAWFFIIFGRGRALLPRVEARDVPREHPRVRGVDVAGDERHLHAGHLRAGRNVRLKATIRRLEE
jgi:hypothetical protein